MIDIDKAYAKMRRARGAKQNHNPRWNMSETSSHDKIVPMSPVRRICPKCQITVLEPTQVKCKGCK